MYCRLCIILSYIYSKEYIKYNSSYNQCLLGDFSETRRTGNIPYFAYAASIKANWINLSVEEDLCSSACPFLNNSRCRCRTFSVSFWILPHAWLCCHIDTKQCSANSWFMFNFYDLILFIKVSFLTYQYMDQLETTQKRLKHFCGWTNGTSVQCGSFSAHSVAFCFLPVISRIYYLLNSSSLCFLLSTYLIQGTN